MIVHIKVTPNASKNKILGFDEGVLKVRIRGVPEKGRVNQELIDFLAEIFEIAKSKIEILNGHTSKFKKVKIEGVIPHIPHPAPQGAE
jgi:uncharacterized protein (TIGR00251 family)